jgi:uncharacterized protein YggT (Ycf19 family)
VGELCAKLFVLADTASSLQRFVEVFFTIYILLILAYVLTSWIRLPYSLSPVQRFLDDVCGPFLRLFRRFLPTLGPLDLSPIVAVFTLVVAQQLLVGLIGRLL